TRHLALMSTPLEGHKRKRFSPVPANPRRRSTAALEQIKARADAILTVSENERQKWRLRRWRKLKANARAALWSFERLKGDKPGGIGAGRRQSRNATITWRRRSSGCNPRSPCYRIAARGCWSGRWRFARPSIADAAGLITISAICARFPARFGLHAVACLSLLASNLDLTLHRSVHMCWVLCQCQY